MCALCWRVAATFDLSGRHPTIESSKLLVFSRRGRQLFFSQSVPQTATASIDLNLRSHTPEPTPCNLLSAVCCHICSATWLSNWYFVERETYYHIIMPPEIAKEMSTSSSAPLVIPSSKYEQDGPEAREIAKHMPYFPFKGQSP